MDRIILIAQQLSKEGKVPTTALIKARLPKDVPLPMIIQGLQKWKENPHKEINIQTEPALTACADSENSGNFDALLDARIKQALTPLVAQINELKTKIAALQKQLTTEDKN